MEDDGPDFEPELRFGWGQEGGFIDRVLNLEDAFTVNAKGEQIFG